MAEQNTHGTSVTVVIPNYNGLRFMEPCMAALEKQNCKDNPERAQTSRISKDLRTNNISVHLL